MYLIGSKKSNPNIEHEKRAIISKHFTELKTEEDIFPYIPQLCLLIINRLLIINFSPGQFVAYIGIGPGGGAPGACTPPSFHKLLYKLLTTLYVVSNCAPPIKTSYATGI